MCWVHMEVMTCRAKQTGASFKRARRQAVEVEHRGDGWAALWILVALREGRLAAALLSGQSWVADRL